MQIRKRILTISICNNDVLFIPMCAEYMQQINKLVSFDELAQLCIQMYGAPLTFNIQCIIATMHSE